MSKKSATVSVRIAPFIKKEAEGILEKLGLPVSVVVDALYRQIIFRGGIPDEMLNFDCRIKAVDEMTEKEFNAMLQKGYDEGRKGKGMDAKELFEELSEMFTP